MSPHVRLGEHEAATLGLVVGLVDLGGISGVRLLDEDMLAGGERAHRPGVVQRSRERDVDRVDLGVAEQFLVRAVRPLDPVLVGVRLSTSSVPRPDRDDLERRIRRRARPGSPG